MHYIHNNIYIKNNLNKKIHGIKTIYCGSLKFLTLSKTHCKKKLSDYMEIWPRIPDIVCHCLFDFMTDTKTENPWKFLFTNDEINHSVINFKEFLFLYR